jgi:hypothetical protein
MSRSQDDALILILNEGKERTRTANKNFAEFVDEWFKEIAPTRLKGAKNREAIQPLMDKKFNEAKGCLYGEVERITT